MESTSTVVWVTLESVPPAHSQADFKQQVARASSEISNLDCKQDPLDEVGRVLLLNVSHLLLNLLHRDLAREDSHDLDEKWLRENQGARGD